MHNHEEKGNNSMMWMIIPCLILLGVLFLGGGKLSGGGYLWPIFIGVFVFAHVWMMFKGHGGHSDNNTEDKSNAPSIKELETKNENGKHISVNNISFF